MDILETIATVVTKVHKVRKDDFFSKNRRTELVEARRQMMAISRNEYGLSTVKIGRFLNRDHSSVVHHCVKHDDLMDVDKVYRDKFVKTLNLITLMSKRPSEVKTIYDILHKQDEKIEALQKSYDSLSEKYIRLKESITNLNTLANG